MDHEQTLQNTGEHRISDFQPGGLANRRLQPLGHISDGGNPYIIKGFGSNGPSADSAVPADNSGCHGHEPRHSASSIRSASVLPAPDRSALLTARANVDTLRKRRPDLRFIAADIVQLIDGMTRCPDDIFARWQIAERYAEIQRRIT